MIELAPTTIFLALAPTIDVFGSYFPAWMLCLVIGLLLTVVAHAILSGLRMAEFVRLKLLTYASMSILFTLITWLVFYRN